MSNENQQIIEDTGASMETDDIPLAPSPEPVEEEEYIAPIVSDSDDEEVEKKAPRNTPYKLVLGGNTIKKEIVQEKIKRGRKLINTKKVLSKKYRAVAYGDIGHIAENNKDLEAFNQLLEEAIEPLDTIDSTEIVATFDDDEDIDNFEIPAQCELSEYILRQLKLQSLKLQKMNCLNMINVQSLQKLNTLIELNIRKGLSTGRQCVHVAANRDKLNHCESAMQCAVIALTILAGDKMPVEAFNVDILERCAEILKQQLDKTIFPEMDSVYAKINNRERAADAQQATSGKRSQWKGAHHKQIAKLFNHSCHMINQLALLVKNPIVYNHEQFILKISSVAISVFFVENVSELQYNALTVCGQMFKHCGKDIRSLIIDELFVNLHHLPQSKRTKRQFKLRRYGKKDDVKKEDSDSDVEEIRVRHDSREDDFIEDSQHIQMFTALILLIVQAGVENSEQDKENNTNNDTLVIDSYRESKHIAKNLLLKLLQKRKNGKQDDFDYKLLFDDIVQDLLITVNRPEWPASEMMLSILGWLLVEYFSQKNIDANLRVGALDCLGSVARKLREDQLIAQEKVETGEIKVLIQNILENLSDKDKKDISKFGDVWDQMVTKEHEDTQSQQIQEQKLIGRLQTILLQHLLHNNQKTDSLLGFCIPFYVGQWLEQLKVSEEQLNSDDLDNSNEDISTNEEKPVALTAKQRVKMNKVIDKSRDRIRENIQIYADKDNKEMIIVDLSYDDSEYITKFLTSQRLLAQSFNTYLSQILKILGEQTVTVRSRGLKSLAEVVEVDPNILTRTEVWSAVHARLNDQATQVREAAIELLGTFMLGRPEIVNKYYHQIADRIDDTGVSVRKRVIKVLRDLILLSRKTSEFAFENSSDACMRILSCIDSEDGIKKLVKETLYSLWFCPVEITKRMAVNEIHNYTDEIITVRADEISDTVMKLLEDEREGFFEALLDSLLSEGILKQEEIAKTEEFKSRREDIRKICQHICDCLAEKLSKSNDESMETDQVLKSNKTVATFYTMNVFCRYDPNFMQENVFDIPPYLKTDVGTKATFRDSLVIVSASSILERTIPILRRPGADFGLGIQASCNDIIMKAVQPGVIRSAVDLLKVVVENLTKRYEEIWLQFGKIFKLIKVYHMKKIYGIKTVNLIKRLVIVLGHFIRAFDLNSETFKGDSKQNVNDVTLKLFTELMAVPELKSIYNDVINAI